MKQGYHLHVLYPDAAERPAYCGNCSNDQTPHMGLDTHAWCGIEGAQYPANHECHLAPGHYAEREQTEDELAHLAELTKGTVFARMSKALVEAAAEGTRELVQVQPGLFMSPQPGRNVKPAEYEKEPAA